MTEHTKQIELDEINKAIADRSDVFYWQTDRAVEPEAAGHIWADRHRYFTDAELVERANAILGDDLLESIEPLDTNAQTNLGNVNSVRAGHLVSGRNVIVRSHPKGVTNGYFHAEATAAYIAKQSGLPSYDTLAVHDFKGGDDFAFQVIEKLPGTAITKWLEAHPESEDVLLPQIGKAMAQLHRIKVEGYGPFDNSAAKDGALVGIHKTLAEAMRAGLPFNLSVLNEQGILTSEQSAAITKLFLDGNPLLASLGGVLVHNDFADWNLLTDGQDITGILDWDECVAGDPVADIACWSTFFGPERLAGFLDGYWQIAEKPDNFQEKFELFRLRYIVSKMTLRLRRATWDKSEFIQQKIESGKAHLAESMRYFNLEQ